MARVSKRLRFEILRRDGFKCRYCGTVAGDTELRIDHVIPDSLGGPNEPSNLATSCEPCNSGKSSVPPDATVVDDVAEGALRWSKAMQQAAAALEEDFLRKRDEQGEFLGIWNRYTVDDKPVPLPVDWAAAITRLRSSGLTLPLIEEAAYAAMAAYNVRADNRFRYFCGVSWNMITGLQKAAIGIVVDGEPPSKVDQPAVLLGFAGSVAEALDAAMDGSGIVLESWQYDELVDQLAQRLRRA